MADNQAKPDKNWVDYIQSLKTRVDNWLAWALLVGIVIAALFGLSAGARGTTGFTSTVVGGLIALGIVGGAVALGAAAGFLFGLPRALTSGEVRELARLNASTTQAGQPGAGAASGAQDPTGTASGGFGANTNLERISDWLTTIIVGIGIANLGSLPAVLDTFGARVDGFFMFGGHVFGIGGGLYFLTFSFLLTYIGTRTKLMLIFTENERDKQSVQGGALTLREAVSESLNRDLLAPRPPDPPGGASATPGASEAAPASAIATASEADQLLVKEVKLTNQQTPDQMLALANASARTGDFAKAQVMYQEYRKVTPFDQRIALDYASVLGMNGDVSGFDALRDEFATRGLGSELSQADNNFTGGMRAALQSNLYNGRYENSIRLGEVLLARPEMGGDAWAHVWLACAYGQRHRLLKARQDEAGAREARDQVVAHVRRAIGLDAGMRSYVRTLYVPGQAISGDDDLVSLYSDKEMNALVDEPAPSPPPPPASAARRRAARRAGS